MGTETIGWSSLRPAMEEKLTNTIGNGALRVITLDRTVPQALSAEAEAVTLIASFSAMTDLSTCATGQIAASRFSTRIAADHQRQQRRASRPSSRCVPRGAS